MSSVPLLRSSPCRSSLWAIKAFSGSSVWHSLHSKTSKAPCNLLETLRLLFTASIFAASLCACCSLETDERPNQRASHIHIYIYIVSTVKCSMSMTLTRSETIIKTYDSMQWRTRCSERQKMAARCQLANFVQWSVSMTKLTHASRLTRRIALGAKTTPIQPSEATDEPPCAPSS